jgi:dihydrofolate reductase
MHVTLLMVSSVNGRITKGDDPRIYTWTSKEDQDFFFDFIKKSTVIIMGRKTYAAARSVIKPTAGKLRIVLTSHPEKYAADTVPGQIEFRNISPSALLKELTSVGVENVTLVGGGEINTLFFRENLIDELYLTIEPFIFGEGNVLAVPGEYVSDMTLISSKKLNAKGTLLLHYRVNK